MNKTSVNLPPDEAALETAANWRSRCDAGLSPAEQARFEQWLAAKPAHAEAWRSVTCASQALDRVRHEHRADDVMREVLRSRRRRTVHRAWWAAMLTLPAAALWIFMLRVGSQRDVPAALSSAQAERRVEVAASAPDLTGEAGKHGLIQVAPRGRSTPEVIKPEIRTLPDGSVVELRLGSEIAVSYTERERRVTLQSGEAYFTVTKDKLRPFVVRSAQVSVRAVGTRFNVRTESTGVSVLVTEGTVAVDLLERQPDAVSVEKPVLLDHGMQMAVGVQAKALAGTRPEAASAAEIEELLAWRKPRLLLANTTLGEAVALLNRESRLRIVITDDALAALPLTGSCYADDSRAFIRLIETALPVRCRTRPDGVIELWKEPDRTGTGGRK